jgi:Amt family ammonium transporter
MGALVIGLLAGVVCLFAVTKLKSALGYDDSLDVFGVHCVGGILGALLTGVFNSPSLGGTGIYDYVAGTWGYAGMGAQVTSQLWGVVTTIVWSGAVAFIAFKLVDVVIGLRVSDEVETEGLDTANGATACKPNPSSGWRTGASGARFLLRTSAQSCAIAGTVLTPASDPS